MGDLHRGTVAVSVQHGPVQQHPYHLSSLYRSHRDQRRCGQLHPLRPLPVLVYHHLFCRRILPEIVAAPGYSDRVAGGRCRSAYLCRRRRTGCVLCRRGSRGRRLRCGQCLPGVSADEPLVLRPSWTCIGDQLRRVGTCDHGTLAAAHISDPAFLPARGIFAAGGVHDTQRRRRVPDCS